MKFLRYVTICLNVVVVVVVRGGCVVLCAVRIFVLSLEVMLISKISFGVKMQTFYVTI